MSPLLAGLASVLCAGCFVSEGFDPEDYASAESDVVESSGQGLDNLYPGYLTPRFGEAPQASFACTAAAVPATTTCMSPLPNEKYTVRTRFKNYFPGDATTCGTCIQLIADNDVSLTLEIADDCTECQEGKDEWGHFEPSCALLDELSSQGAIHFDEDRQVWPIKWKFAPCEPEGAVQYRFKSGSNPSWLAVQPAQHRSRIVDVTLRSRVDGSEHPPTYLDNNGFWVFSENPGAGPFDVLLTNEDGKTIQDDEVFAFEGQALQALGGRALAEELVNFESGKMVMAVEGRIQL